MNADQEGEDESPTPIGPVHGRRGQRTQKDMGGMQNAEQLRGKFSGHLQPEQRQEECDAGEGAECREGGMCLQFADDEFSVWFHIVSMVRS